MTITVLETDVELVGTTVSVDFQAPGGTTDVETVGGFSVQTAPAGHVVTARVTTAAKPTRGVTVMVEVAVAPLVTGDGARGVEETLKL